MVFIDMIKKKEPGRFALYQFIWVIYLVINSYTNWIPSRGYKDFEFYVSLMGGLFFFGLFAFYEEFKKLQNEVNTLKEDLERKRYEDINKG